MANNIFSQNYYSGNQTNFKQLLKNQEFEKAYAIVQKFPSQEENPVEDVKRIITIGEAYKALALTLMHSDKPNTPNGDLEAITRYSQTSKL